MMDVSSLPFRRAVQVYVVNGQKQFLLQSPPKYDSPVWKIPSGGAEPGENAEQTVHRELQEEFSVSVEIIAKSKQKNEFLWPLNLVEKEGFRWKGQSQDIFVVRLSGKQILKPNPAEVKDIKWVTKEQVHAFFKFPNQLESAKKIFAEFPQLF